MKRDPAKTVRKAEVVVAAVDSGLVVAEGAELAGVEIVAVIVADARVAVVDAVAVVVTAAVAVAAGAGK